MSDSHDVHALIVDDDAGVLFYHKMMVTESSLKVEVLTFDEGAEAIEYIEEQKESSISFLIFLDISMPDMNGWAFLDYLEENDLNENVYIIMVTSSLNEKDEKRARSHPNVVHYTDKPITKSVCSNLRNLESLKHLPI